MKRVLWSMAMAAAVAVSVMGAAAAGDAGGFDRDALMQEAMVLHLANQLGLDTQKTVDLLNKFREQCKQVGQLKEQRAGVAQSLKAGEGDVAAQLDQLKNLDKQILDAKQQAAAAAAEGLDPAAQAHLYLLLTMTGEEGHGKYHEGQPGGMAEGGAAPQAEAAAANPNEAIMKQVQVFAEGLAAQDIDQVMSIFAEDFEHYEYGNKAGLKDFIGQAIDMGYLEGVETHTEDAEIEMKDGEAIVYPVDVSAAFGSVTFEFTFAKQDDGSWKVNYLEAEGI
ncbi:MAG: nuclear transport factor 2 family protein [Candidatus Hydrogenedentes bacterium]|nr:nuclear transport factor 2 family protein [Candidatus Hydrogenedentota bacterium]